MKPRKNVSYFPVNSSEQALLLRVREPDLGDRVDELVEMLDQIADAHLSAADLELAIQLLVASRQGEALDGRFDNLEARLRERIEKGLSEIEGRLSRRLADPATDEAARVTVPATTPPPAEPRRQREEAVHEVPKEASVAFRVGRDLVWGPSAAQFYVAIWRWLFEHRHVQIDDLPIQGGKERFVVATSPVHPSGKPFTRADQPTPGVFLEVNLSRQDILRRAQRYLTDRGVSFEIVVGSN